MKIQEISIPQSQSSNSSAFKEGKLSEIKLYYKPKISAKPKINCSSDAYANALKFYDHNTIALQEQFIILYLNRANMALGAH